MKEQNKSPLKFAGLAASAVSGGGSGAGFRNRDYTMSDWVQEGNSLFDRKEFMDRSNTVEREKMNEELAYSAPTSRVQTSYSSVDANNGTSPAASNTLASAPATISPTTIGPASGGNPFEGKTFTISPAQMRNVKNVFGDTDERQTSVGQNTGQGSENYDTYEEESPLTKKSCGSYKK